MSALYCKVRGWAALENFQKRRNVSLSPGGSIGEGRRDLRKRVSYMSIKIIAENGSPFELQRRGVYFPMGNKITVRRSNRLFGEVRSKPPPEDEQAGIAASPR